jgi:hypothetical protein
LNETNQSAIRVMLPTARKHPLSAAGLWRRLPTIAKCVVIVPVTMALLGAEVQLRLSPQLDVIITPAGVWGIWAWLNGRTPPVV